MGKLSLHFYKSEHEMFNQELILHPLQLIEFVIYILLTSTNTDSPVDIFYRALSVQVLVSIIDEFGGLISAETIADISDVIETIAGSVSASADISVTVNTGLCFDLNTSKCHQGPSNFTVHLSAGVLILEGQVLFMLGGN